MSYFEERADLHYEIVRADIKKGAYVPTGRFYRKVDSIEDNDRADLSFLDPKDNVLYRMRRVNPTVDSPTDDGGGTPVALVA